MEWHDVIIIGGGPAGSSCAKALRSRGVEPLILDRETFPRLKLCAGWITPEVVADTGLEPSCYPHSFMTFERLRIHFKGLSFPFKNPQHSIRRVEFDDWLLRRSGAEIRQHNVKNIHSDQNEFVIDDAYRCKWLVGAGGTRCPVYRELFKETAPRDETCQAAALEHEIAHNWSDGDCHLWFFVNGLPGYAWYVPKAGGHLNAGVGGVASLISSRGQHVKTHWQMHVDEMKKEGLVRDIDWKPKGFTYYVQGAIQTFQLGNAFVCGDAAGLATRDLAEGIGPAIRSGVMAANSIVDGVEYDPGQIARHSLQNIAGRVLDWAFCRKS